MSKMQARIGGKLGMGLSAASGEVYRIMSTIEIRHFISGRGMQITTEMKSVISGCESILSTFINLGDYVKWLGI
jgi:hypothetical protein